MIRRYEVALLVPNRREGCWTPTVIGRYATTERALRRCERVLARHETHETRASRERFPFYCEIYDRKLGDGVLCRAVEGDSRKDAPVRLVPSVGELGWTP